ncbi:MAG: NADH-quinone oxidoreductase subunit NuoK [candidate division Zixibacteria bacterium]|nr:NADH-quinone oxidoreductase subunit NuoK [candidate division Zixibacteria bacterium]
MAPLNHYLILSALLFAIGVWGVLKNRNVLIIFMSIELMLNAVNITLMAFSSFMKDFSGQVFIFLVMAVAAAEVAVGLAIIVSIFRAKETVNVDDINIMKW